MNTVDRDAWDWSCPICHAPKGKCCEKLRVGIVHAERAEEARGDRKVIVIQERKIDVEFG
jgi:hypothetical protein